MRRRNRPGSGGRAEIDSANPGRIGMTIAQDPADSAAMFRWFSNACIAVAAFLAHEEAFSSGGRIDPGSKWGGARGLGDFHDADAAPGSRAENLVDEEGMDEADFSCGPSDASPDSGCGKPSEGSDALSGHGAVTKAFSRGPPGKEPSSFRHRRAGRADQSESSREMFFTGGFSGIASCRAMR